MSDFQNPYSYRKDKDGVLLIWTVYQNPSDFPGHVVVRGSYVMPGHPDPLARPDKHVFGSVEAARVWLKRDPNLTRLERNPDDDECIVETWL